MDADQVRVILWTIPRTVSTAFLKCMSNLDDVQIIHEPYLSVYYYGPDGKEIPNNKAADMANAVQLDYDAGWDSVTTTYKYIKENLLEAEYTRKKVVFVKDMSFGISGKFKMLPNGYRHAFLIRKPVRVFASWKNVIIKFPKIDGRENNVVADTYFIPKYYGFGESLHLYEYLVSSGIEPNPAIIDSDDLLENPTSILKQFCGRTGIPYSEKLLNWDAGEDVVQKWKASNIFMKSNKIFKFYSDAFESTRFYKSKPEPKRSELDEDVNEAIDATLAYYEKLYELRIKP